MRILITGGYGFLGARVAQYLQQCGHQIFLGARQASASPEWLPQAKVLQIDWKDGRNLEQTCAGIDAVIHAAGMNAHDCATDPVGALEFNGVATARLIDASIRVGVQKFLYFSTAHVYASPLQGSISEDACPRNMHPYASSHLAGENAVLNAAKCKKIKSMVLRLSNVFGPPAHNDVNCWTLLVNELCRQAVSDEKLTLRSSGLQRRDFVGIQDMCRAVSHVLGLNKEQIGDGVFNVGGAWAPRVIDMTELIQARCLAVLGFTPQIIRPESHGMEATHELDFRIDRLLASGFALSDNSVAEIDATLIFCREFFGYKR